MSFVAVVAGRVIVCGVTNEKSVNQSRLSKVTLPVDFVGKAFKVEKDFPGIISDLFG